MVKAPNPRSAVARIAGCAAITPSLAALHIQAINRDFQEAYENLLDGLVFCRSIEDRKAARKFQKVLRDYTAYGVLQLIWVESPYVSEDDLQSFGVDRTFAGRELTCWGLATKIAEKGDFGKVHSQIRTIVKAGEAYGLVAVERQAKGPKRKPLVGSRLLHELVVDLSQTSARILVRRLGLDSLWDITYDL
jgi:hypothetical protein